MKGVKTVSEIRGLSHIKSLSLIGRRSIPQSQSSNYLTLYMLKRCKDRFEHEMETLGKRGKYLKKRLKEVNKSMVKLLEEEDLSEYKEEHQEAKAGGKGTLKKMALKY